MKQSAVFIVVLACWSGLLVHSLSSTSKLSGINEQLEFRVLSDDFDANMREAMKMLETAKREPQQCDSALTLCESLELFTKLQGVLGDMRCTEASINILKENNEAAGGVIGKNVTESSRVDKMIQQQALKHAQMCIKAYTEEMNVRPLEAKILARNVSAELEKEQKSFSSAWRAAVTKTWFLKPRRLAEVVFKVLQDNSELREVKKTADSYVDRRKLARYFGDFMRDCEVLVEWNNFVPRALFDAKSYLSLGRPEYKDYYQHLADVSICDRLFNERKKIERDLKETFAE